MEAESRTIRFPYSSFSLSSTAGPSEPPTPTVGSNGGADYMGTTKHIFVPTRLRKRVISEVNDPAVINSSANSHQQHQWQPSAGPAPTAAPKLPQANSSAQTQAAKRKQTTSEEDEMLHQMLRELQEMNRRLMG